jgi:hypothetical protein
MRPRLLLLLASRKLLVGKVRGSSPSVSFRGQHGSRCGGSRSLRGRNFSFCWRHISFFWPKAAGVSAPSPSVVITEADRAATQASFPRTSAEVAAPSPSFQPSLLPSGPRKLLVREHPLLSANICGWARHFPGHCDTGSGLCDSFCFLDVTPAPSPEAPPDGRGPCRVCLAWRSARQRPPRRAPPAGALRSRSGSSGCAGISPLPRSAG